MTGLAIVSPPEAGACDLLDVIAGKIRASLQRSDDQRVTAARLLLEAKGRVEAGEAGKIGWRQWCEENIKRSQRDIRFLIACARSPDPEAAIASERERARQGMRRIRKQRNVTPLSSPLQWENLALPLPASGALCEAETPDDGVFEKVKAEVCALSAKDKERFWAWFRREFSRLDPAVSYLSAHSAPVGVLAIEEAIKRLSSEELPPLAGWLKAWAASQLPRRGGRNDFNTAEPTIIKF
jgi:hypothetical protein